MYKIQNLDLAIIAAIKRAQEMSFQYGGGLVEGEKNWYEVPFFKSIPKAWVKSIWKHYLK